LKTETQLERSAPEAQGIASPAILAFVEAAEQHNVELHSFMLLRYGCVVAEGWWAPYEREDPHMLFSLSKSFTSTGIGLLVAEGKVGLDDPVLSFFSEDAPPQISEHLAAMRVRHLLSMSTGHVDNTLGPIFGREDGNWAKAFLASPVERAPGTHFLYNSGATYMLSAIVQHITGVTLVNYLRPRLFEPLGIENPTWETCPRGINTGGWGLSIKTDGIARFGQLYLQDGMWQGERILPEGWVAEATARQVSNGPNANIDWEQGYGFQFWRCRHGAYRGDGAFGQFCVVMPEQDAVLAVTSGQQDVQVVLNLVWKHLLPAIEPSTLPLDSKAQEQLDQKLARLILPQSKGQHTSSVGARVSGQRFVCEPNEHNIEAIWVDFKEEGCALTIEDEHGTHQVGCGADTWKRGTTTINSPGSTLIAASGAWAGEDTYLIYLRCYETPFGLTITCRFIEDRLVFEWIENVSFGPLERKRIEGTNQSAISRQQKGQADS